MTPFERMVADRMAEQGWSAREVSKRAEARGAALSHTTVARIARGGYSAPKQETIDALAVALGVPANTLREAAGVEQDHGPWVPPDEARFLSVEDRRLLDAMVRRLAMGVAVRD